MAPCLHSVRAKEASMPKASTAKIQPRALVARDLMTADPTVIDTETTIGEALDILATLEIRHLPVVTDGVLVGMLSEKDLMSSAGVAEKMARRVSSVMNTNVVSVDPDATVSDIAAAIVDNRVGAVPVVDGHEGDVVGIVSYVDVLRDLIQA